MNCLDQAGPTASFADRDGAGGDLVPRGDLIRLGRLLIAIARGIDPPGADPGAPGDDGSSWHDEEYLYIEARLSRPAEGPIDISAHGRTLFVRVAR